MRPKLEIIVRGVMTPDQVEYACITKGTRSAWLPVRAFADVERVARSAVADRGLILTTSEWRDVVEQVGAIDFFAPECVAEQTGWIDGVFPLSCGESFTAKGVQPPAIAFEVDQISCQTAGTLDAWIEGVARLLNDQHLPLTILLAMFASPLLQLTGRKDNFGFEIVGREGRGKSTIQRIAASACGAAYWTSLNTTLDAIEGLLPAHNSMTMVLDEANLFYGDLAADARGAKFRALAFRMATGDIKLRFAGKRTRRYSFIYVISGNDRLEHLIRGNSRATTRAAGDRLMTLQVPDQPYGVFEFVPDGYAGSEEFAKALDAAAEANAGHAIRAFLQQLVEDRADDEPGLQKLIQTDIARFREKAGVGHNDGSVGRVADAFGLLYAGGRMAQRYGVLPDELAVGRSVLYCYEHMLVGSKPPLSFDRLFARYLNQPGVRNIDERGIKHIGQRQFAAIPAFLKTNRKKQLEALVDEKALSRVIPEWQKLIAKDGTHCVLDRDGDHLTKKRVVRSNAEDRLVVIRIADGFLTA